MSIIKRKSLTILRACCMVLVITAGLLSACTTNSIPIITGSWKDLQSPLQTLSELNISAESLLPLVENVPKISIARTAMFHNFSLPVSRDGKWIAYYQQDDEGAFSMEILPTAHNTSAEVISIPLGSSISRSHEGFSGNGKYFAFTIQDLTTKKQQIQLVSLAKQQLLDPIENTFFMDFTSTGEEIYALTLNDSNTVTGLVSVRISDRNMETLYQPSETENIGFAFISPDEQWIIYCDYNSQSLFRVPIKGGASTLIYDYTGSTPSANYDPFGNYLVVIDTSSDSTTVKLFDHNFSNIYTLNGMGSSEMSYSENGEYLVYQLYSENAMDLFVTNFMEGSYHLQANTGQLYRTEISPDQKYLVFISYAYYNENQGDLYIAPLTTLTSSKISSNVTSFSFAQDDSLLFTTIDKANNQSSIYQNRLGETDINLLVGPSTGVITIIN
jgi:hypothetical protein